MENTCVCCGAVIPEGRQVCPNCEARGYDPEEFFGAERDSKTNYDYIHSLDLNSLASYMAEQQFSYAWHILNPLGFDLGTGIKKQMTEHWIEFLKRPVQTVSTLEELIAGRPLHERET